MSVYTHINYVHVYVCMYISVFLTSGYAYNIPRTSNVTKDMANLQYTQAYGFLQLPLHVHVHVDVEVQCTCTCTCKTICWPCVHACTQHGFIHCRGFPKPWQWGVVPRCVSALPSCNYVCSQAFLVWGWGPRLGFKCCQVAMTMYYGYCAREHKSASQSEPQSSAPKRQEIATRRCTLNWPMRMMGLLQSKSRGSTLTTSSYVTTSSPTVTAPGGTGTTELGWGALSDYLQCTRTSPVHAYTYWVLPTQRYSAP